MGRDFDTIGLGSRAEFGERKDEKRTVKRPELKERKGAGGPEGAAKDRRGSEGAGGPGGSRFDRVRNGNAVHRADDAKRAGL